MDILIRKAAESDAWILAQMNKALIHDEGSRNPMTIQQVEERMRGWLDQSFPRDAKLTIDVLASNPRG